MTPDWARGVNLGRLLRLERPLASADLETTGVVFEMDRIIQIALTMHWPDGREPTRWKTFVDPMMPIPAEATQKNKIADADVAGAPTFAQLAPALARKLDGCDWIGYNLLAFDLPFLRASFKAAGADWDWEGRARVVDVQKAYFVLRPRTLEDCYKEFVDPGGFEGAHEAGNDVAAHEASLAGMLLGNPSLPRTVAGLADFCSPRKPGWVDSTGKIVWRAREACVGFGQKHNGRPLRVVAREDPGYFSNFMLGPKGNFPADTKAIVRDALAGIFPLWEATL